MAPLPVEFHPEAVAEASAAVRWYKERSDSAADAFLAELDRGIEKIVQAPRMWPEYAKGTRRFLLRRFPFSLIAFL